MKALTKISIGFLALVAVALWFTSCSSEDVTSGTNQGKMSSLTLTINTGKSMDSRATDWTTDPGADKMTTENKINRVAIGIFSHSGAVKTIVELTPSTTGTNSFSQTDANNAKATIVTSSLVADAGNADEVLVAINAPSGRFTGCQSKSDFMAKTETAVEALANSTDAQVATNIPMFGSASLSGTGSSFTANVSVIHMIAKVSLTSLKVDFKAGSAYADAQFTPKAVFLINVPNSLQFDNDNAWTSAGYEHGWGTFATDFTYDATTANSSAASTFKGSTFAKYLTTSELKDKTLKGEDASYDKSVYFYTMPNGQDGDKATKLVIAGKFKATGVDKVVYYPLFLNAKVNSTGTGYDPAVSGSDAKKVYPNKNYNCKVVIRNIGADSPNTNLDPKTATISISVTDFVTADQTTEFN
nr:hypothetical protein [Prevotella sp.]